MTTNDLALESSQDEVEHLTLLETLKKLTQKNSEVANNIEVEKRKRLSHR
jgi:hypothetical protein